MQGHRADLAGVPLGREPCGLRRPRAAYQTKPLQIGMAKSFVTDQPKSVVEVATNDFKDVMKKATGLNGELVSKFDAKGVAEKSTPSSSISASCTHMNSPGCRRNIPASSRS